MTDNISLVWRARWRPSLPPRSPGSTPTFRNQTTRTTWTFTEVSQLFSPGNSRLKAVLIIAGPGTEGFKSSTLRINKLHPEDLGAYTCRANNKLGRAETVIKVERDWSQNCERNCVWEEEVYDNAGQTLTTSILAIILSALLAQL